MGHSRSRSRSPKRRHKSKHYKKRSRSHERSRSRKHSKDRRSKSRYVLGYKSRKTLNINNKCSRWSVNSQKETFGELCSFKYGKNLNVSVSPKLKRLESFSLFWNYFGLMFRRVYHHIIQIEQSLRMSILNELTIFLCGRVEFCNCLLLPMWFQEILPSLSLSEQ